MPKVLKTREELIDYSKKFKRWFDKKRANLNITKPDLNLEDSINFNYLEAQKKAFLNERDVQFDSNIPPSTLKFFNDLILADEKLFYLADDLNRSQMIRIKVRKRNHDFTEKSESREVWALLINYLWEFKRRSEQHEFWERRGHHAEAFYGLDQTLFSCEQEIEEQARAQKYSIQLLLPLLPNKKEKISVLMDTILAYDQVRLKKALLELKFKHGGYYYNRHNALLITQSTYPPDFISYLLTRFPANPESATHQDILRNFIILLSIERVEQYKKANPEAPPSKLNSPEVVSLCQKVATHEHNHDELLDNVPATQSFYMSVRREILEGWLKLKPEVNIEGVGTYTIPDFTPWSWDLIDAEIRKFAMEALIDRLIHIDDSRCAESLSKMGYTFVDAPEDSSDSENECEQLMGKMSLSRPEGSINPASVHGSIFSMSKAYASEKDNQSPPEEQLGSQKGSMKR